MIQVHNNLFVGNFIDYDSAGLMDIISVRPNTTRKGTRHFCIDMVDATSPRYFHIEQFDVILKWISPFQPTLIHCDMGRSRGPSVAMYYMARKGYINNMSYYSAAREFRTIYPLFAPGQGIREFMAMNWPALMNL